MTSQFTDLIIRNATPTDIEAIQTIYAYYVSHSLATFEEDPPSIAEMTSRFANIRQLGMPYLVAEKDSRILGYAYATGYRPRPAYRFTIENSVYVDKDFHRKSIGRGLLGALISRCEEGPWHQMLAVIGDSANVGSIGLHTSFGFRSVGTLQNAGFKSGQWVDTVLLQKALKGL